MGNHFLAFSFRHSDAIQATRSLTLLLWHSGVPYFSLKKAWCEFSARLGVVRSGFGLRGRPRFFLAGSDTGVDAARLAQVRLCSPWFTNSNLFYPACPWASRGRTTWAASDRTISCKQAQFPLPARISSDFLWQHTQRQRTTGRVWGGSPFNMTCTFFTGPPMTSEILIILM